MRCRAGPRVEGVRGDLGERVGILRQYAVRGALVDLVLPENPRRLRSRAFSALEVANRIAGKERRRSDTCASIVARTGPHVAGIASL